MMRTRHPRDRSLEYEKALKRRGSEKFVLRLYIAGMTPASQRALLNVQAICETHLQGRYDLEVIDIYQQPVLPEGEQIIAVPTLVKRLPEPLRKFIGDLSNQDRILVGLDLKKKKTTAKKES